LSFISSEGYIFMIKLNILKFVLWTMTQQKLQILKLLCSKPGTFNTRTGTIARLYLKCEIVPTNDCCHKCPLKLGCCCNNFIGCLSKVDCDSNSHTWLTRCNWLQRYRSCCQLLLQNDQQDILFVLRPFCNLPFLEWKLSLLGVLSYHCTSNLEKFAS